MLYFLEALKKQISSLEDDWFKDISAQQRKKYLVKHEEKLSKDFQPLEKFQAFSLKRSNIDSIKKKPEKRSELSQIIAATSAFR